MSDPDFDTEQFDAQRVLDANANRAREAMRVLEDHVRFALDDAHAASRLKQMRHDLAQATKAFSGAELLEARDTIRDVGTRLETPGERRRPDVGSVVAANVKRLQEALRAMEEFGKLVSPHFARQIEAIRYEAYTLEKILLLGPHHAQQLHGRLLYVLVTESLCAGSLEWTVKEALAGGADVIQLREKELDDRTLLDRARRVAAWTHEAGALFIMNDRADIARLAGADGVHVGQDELPGREARRIVGPGKLVGVSTHDIDQAAAAVADGASYLGVGPVFPSSTKSFDALAGLATVRDVAATVRTPWFAIGGVTVETIGQVIDAGARRVAVSAAVIGTSKPREAARVCRRRLAQAAEAD